MAEWLWRWTRNPMGSPRAGSTMILLAAFRFGTFFKKVSLFFSLHSKGQFVIVNPKMTLHLERKCLVVILVHFAFNSYAPGKDLGEKR